MKIFEPNFEYDINGILRQNPNTFELFASTTNTDVPRIYYILNASPNYYWCSYDTKWQYFEITFNNYYVSLSTYILNFDGFGISSVFDYPIQWVVAGVDENEIRNISIVANSGINENCQTKSFKIKNNNFYKKYRFTSIGKTTREHDFFCIANFDIFGIVLNRVRSNICITFHQKGIHINMNLILLTILS